MKALLFTFFCSLLQAQIEFKNNKGLLVPDTMKASIGLKTEMAGPQSLNPLFVIPLQGLNQGQELVGFLSKAQKEALEKATVLSLVSPNQPETGLKSWQIRPSGFAGMGEFEISVIPEKSVLPESEFGLKIESGLKKVALAIPQEAFLQTVEGGFVYTKNSRYLKRSAVVTGVKDGQHIEIVQGLYEGDEIVTSGVKMLWMAELQALRGGKPCTCGH